jgi:hypothetical protein
MKTTYPMGLAVPKMTNWWDQHNLSIEEASAYFRIGEHTVRRLIANNPDANFILRVGNHTLVKKHLFAAFLDGCHSL